MADEIIHKLKKFVENTDKFAKEVGENVKELRGNRLRFEIPNAIVIPSGAFEVELLDVCPTFNLAEFHSWDIVIKTITTGKVTLTSIRDISDLSELQINKFDSGAMCFFLSGHSKAGFTIPAGSVISLNK